MWRLRISQTPGFQLCPSKPCSDEDLQVRILITEKIVLRLTSKHINTQLRCTQDSFAAEGCILYENLPDMSMLIRFHFSTNLVLQGRQQRDLSQAISPLSC